MMSATPIPSKPCLRNSVLATSTTFSRFAAACSRDTFINQPLPLYKISIDTIHDVRHEYIYMMTVINTKAHNEALVTAQSQTNSIMEVRHFFSEGRSHETSMEQTRTNHPERKATHNSRLADGAPLFY